MIIKKYTSKKGKYIIELLSLDHDNLFSIWCYEKKLSNNKYKIIIIKGYNNYTKENIIKKFDYILSLPKIKNLPKYIKKINYTEKIIDKTI